MAYYNMPRKYVKRSRRPAKRTRRPGKRTGKGYVTKAQVARMIGRRIEDKYDYQSNSPGQDVSNIVASGSPYFNQLNVAVTQASPGQGGRIGNKITVKNAIIKGSINFKDYSSLSNSRCLDQLVTVVIFKCRTYLAGTNPTTANFFSRMFQLGSSATGLSNLPIDHLRRFNKDLMMVKAVRHFKMGYSSNFTGGPAATTGQQPVPNNDFKYQQFFRIPLTKFYKKTQIWDDATGASDSRNDNLFIMCFTCPADGSAFTSTPLLINWDWELTYEDA